MKTCVICKKEKEVSEFNKNKGRKDGLQSECKECSKEISRKYYYNNKERMVIMITKNTLANRLEKRKKFFEFLKNCQCVDCGNTNPMVLEFDHKDSHDKKHEVSKMVHDNYSWDRVLNEINKCEVRCANCHRIKTSKEQGWYSDMISNATAIK